MWLSVFTLLRLFALAFLVYLATERLRAAPPARMSRDSTADAVSAAAGSDIASSVPGEGPGEGDTARPNH